MDKVWQQIRLQLQTKLRLYQTCIYCPFCCIRFGSVDTLAGRYTEPWGLPHAVRLLGYVGTTSSEILRSSLLPTSPLFRTSSPPPPGDSLRGGTHYLATSWDLTFAHSSPHIITSCDSTYLLFPQPRLAPALRLSLLYGVGYVQHSQLWAKTTHSYLS